MNWIKRHKLTTSVFIVTLLALYVFWSDISTGDVSMFVPVVGLYIVAALSLEWIINKARSIKNKENNNAR